MILVFGLYVKTHILYNIKSVTVKINLLSQIVANIFRLNNTILNTIVLCDEIINRKSKITVVCYIMFIEIVIIPSETKKYDTKREQF